MFNATPGSLYHRERDPTSIVQDAEWAPGSIWMMFLLVFTKIQLQIILRPLEVVPNFTRTSYFCQIYFNTKWSIHLSNIRMNYSHSKHHICEDRCKSVLVCNKQPPLLSRYDCKIVTNLFSVPQLVLTSTEL